MLKKKEIFWTNVWKELWPQNPYGKVSWFNGQFQCNVVGRYFALKIIKEPSKQSWKYKH